MGPTWGPPGSCRPQMGPMLTPWTLLSRIYCVSGRTCRTLSQYKYCLNKYGIPELKIRQSRDCLIFNMGIPMLVRRHLYIEMAPRLHYDTIRYKRTFNTASQWWTPILYQIIVLGFLVWGVCLGCFGENQQCDTRTTLYVYQIEITN